MHLLKYSFTHSPSLSSLPGGHESSPEALDKSVVSETLFTGNFEYFSMKSSLNQLFRPHTLSKIIDFPVNEHNLLFLVPCLRLSASANQIYT